MKFESGVHALKGTLSAVFIAMHGQVDANR